ncbi:disease resistance-like protein DSC1 [Pistacia vera]|uniref:disease resistance-like protein DSC1 n=1 Tax=Pistacia vera TaxID=55513 RepID=UPI00126336F8|nr:disease resistance-like protein DSC1 [Pistacia vera]
MRGIGKRTIAKSVFDKISNQFEGSYFVRNIREESTGPYGLTRMQQELLSSILKHPIGFTKGRLGRKQVLIILDDVTTLEQPIFLLKYLVALDMPHSNIEQLWSSTQLQNLKHIDLSFSKHLKIQDLSLASNLENLILEGCTSLCEIASSIYGLNYKLLILNLTQCKSLGSLPTGIRLESPKKVIFSGCSNLKLFSQISWNMKELYLDQTAIKELPSSIEKLSRLVILNLKDWFMLERLPSNISVLKSLEYLNLSGCSILHGLPDNLGNLEALRVLKAEGVPMREVPTSILNLRCLEELDLTSCGIEELPNNLGQLSSLKSLLLGRNSLRAF